MTGVLWRCLRIPYFLRPQQILGLRKLSARAFQALIGRLGIL